ncbi:helix-turn-helix domain-containing protein [Pseudoflavonifractor phocaeensis]|uniref:helix-turn-helix domain-containing protein n=1 Tax=Pseudoflavonifractor phocaeensis TaxID=1870988 RepID=UPI00195752DA|nr:helix-turn-helix domain-containing protein [Pseudoflavonifractor phocaeensis]
MKKEKMESQSVNPQLVFTVREAAKILHLGLNKCYELVRCKRLRSIRVGKKIIIPKAAISEFLNETDDIPAYAGCNYGR